jgi:MFS family permease
MLNGVKSSFEHYSKNILDLKFLVIIIMVALVIDMEISNEAHLIYKYIATDIGVTIFILTSFIYLILQQYILSYSRKEQAQIQVGRSSFRIIQRIINFMIFFIIICFLTIILEILIPQYYDSFLLLLVLVASNAIAIIAMSDMSSKFFSWYQNRKQATILIFGAMASIIAITAFFTVLFMAAVLVDQPSRINANTRVSLPIVEEGSILSILNYLYYYLAVISYVITWIITSLLLKDYVNKLGKLKYWIVLSMPLVFYLSQLLVTQFGLFIPEDAAGNFTFQMWFLFFYTPSSLIGGVLFSIPFLLIIKKLKTSKPLENFLRITAYGLILFFAAGSATVYHTPYPPFGLLTVAAIGPSTYLIAVGIYFSARIISRNRTIEIRMKRTSEYSQFFANIGFAEMEKVVTEIVEELGKKLPPDEGEASGNLETVDREIIDYLKKYQARKRSQEY